MTEDPNRPLDDVQDEILDRLHAGETVDREAVLAANPAHADALRQFFAVLDVIEAPPPPAAPAQARLGEFRIVREIGRGGMGIVYEAEQTSLGRRVALKVLPPALQVDGRVLARFRREAEAAGRLRHPNVVPVYVFGEAAGTPFLAMELVEGQSLAQTIAERKAALERGEGASPADREAHRRLAAEVIARVADALDYAHGRGILHRDVKPGNILVEKDGTPRLTDFGLALDLDAASLTLAGEVFGSPLYMSPEQAFRRESPVDARSDVYSLAVTLYELLTLRLPYDGVTQAEVLTALGSGAIVPPRTYDPGMPPALEQVILRALRKDPRERHATAAAFASDVRAAVEGRPVAPPPALVSPPPIPVAAAVVPPPIPIAAAAAPAGSFAATSPPAAPAGGFVASSSPPESAAAAPAKSRSVWPWVLGGCAVLTVLPCLVGMVWMFTGDAEEDQPADPTFDVRFGGIDRSTGPELGAAVGMSSAPETRRAAMVQGLIRAANDAMSGDARTMVVQTVPEIPGGITAAELADAVEDMMNGDRAATIVAVAPYVRPGMTAKDIRRLTEDLFSNDKPKVLLALADAGSKLAAQRPKAEPAPIGGNRPDPEAAPEEPPAETPPK